MKILHVIAAVAPRYGGPSLALPAMCSATVARGHVVEVMTTNIDGPEVLGVPLGVPVRSDGYDTTYFAIGRPRSWRASFALARALRERVAEFDVVHVHSLYLFHTTVAAFYCRRHGVPYVIRPHGTLTRFQRGFGRGRKRLYDALLERRNLNRAAAIQFTSERERDEAAELHLRAPAYVVPLGVSFPDAWSESNTRTARRRIVYVGRFAAKKRLDLLVDAFAEVARGRADAELVLAGPDDGKLTSELEERARRLGVREQIVFCGPVTGEAKSAVLREAAVFVLLSEDENFALAALEALAVGTPVVATPTVALAREVESAGAGLMVAPDVPSVAAAICSFLDDEAFAMHARGRARRLAEQYGIDRVAAELEEMYLDVLRRAGRLPASGSTSVRAMA